MRLELYRAHWEMILPLLGDWKAATDKVEAALSEDGDIVGVEVAVPGVRKMADLIGDKMWPLANYLRGLCNAAEVENW